MQQQFLYNYEYEFLANVIVLKEIKSIKDILYKFIFFALPQPVYYHKYQHF